MATINLNARGLLDIFNPNIIITPTNGVTKGSEDGTLTGMISVQDPSLLGTGLLNSGVKVTASLGKYGTLVLGSDTDASSSGFVGSYTYTPNQSAREGVVVSDTFTITAVDGAGRSVQRTLKLSYTGVNDQPVLKALSVQPTPILEATTGVTKLMSAVTGNFSVKDVDVGDTLTASMVKSSVALDGGAEVPPELKTALTNGFTLGKAIKATGGDQTISYTYAKRDLDLNFLAKDQKLTVTFDVVVTDNSKNKASEKSATQSVTFTFVGTNDAPTLETPKVITLEDTVGDDSFTVTTGTLVGKDVDLKDVLVYGIEGEVAVDGIATKVGKFGVLTVNTTTGQYEYKANDAAVEALTANNAETFVVTVFDGTAIAKANLAVNITATNDKPILQVIEDIEFVDTAADDEFSAVSGSVSASDPDSDITYTIEGGVTNGGESVKVGAYGILRLNTQNGQFTFTPDDTAIEGQIERVTEDFMITAFDGKLKDTKNLTIVVNGADDTAEIGGNLSADLTEDATDNTFEGIVTVADRDFNQNGFQAVAQEALKGTYGTFTFNNTTGAWTYTLDNGLDATNALVKNAMVTDTLSITTTGNVPQNLVVNITGANDAPVANAATDAVAEDAIITGNVSGSDVDSGETATLTFELVNAAPTGLTFNPDGSYSFDASSYDSLNVGQKLDITVPFVAKDVNGQASAAANLVITITGTNDAPVANAATNAVDEDAIITGNVSGSDVDSGETATLTFELVNAAPTGLTFNPDGSYSFDASSYDSLNVGQKLDITVPFVAKDVNDQASAVANLVITITGTNDAPVANAAINAVAEDAIITGNVSGSDVDTGETATLTFELVNAAPTGLTFNADGSYSFDASSYDSLNDGDTLDITVPFIAKDVNGQASAVANLVITITGVNDVPVANAAVASVAEDATTSGTVTATDADEGETAGLTFALVDDAPVGLTFNADGTYSFDASSYDQLAKDEKLELTVPFVAKDATSTSEPANLVITITGINDAPTVTAATVYTETGLTFTVSDVDNNAVLSVKQPQASYFNTTSVNDDAPTTLTVLAQSDAPQQGSLVIQDEHGAVTPTAGFLAVGTDGDDGVGDALFALSAPGAIYGFGGDDRLRGTGDDDFLFGGEGNDTLIAGGGNDLISGGAGNDTARLDVGANGFDADTIRLGNELKDRIIVDGVATDKEVLVSFISGAVGNGNGDSAVTGDSAHPAVRMQLQTAGSAGAATSGGVTRFDDEGVTLTGARFNVIGLDNAGTLVPAQNRGVFDEVVLGTDLADSINESSSSDDYYFNGGQGDDVFRSGSGKDFLVGGAGNDNLSGGGDDDKFIGGAGNDVINGGTGDNDTSIYTGAFANYTITKNVGGTITVTDNRTVTPNDGTDTVSNVDFLAFSDVTVSVLPAAPTAIELFAEDSGVQDDDISNDTTPTAKVTLAAPKDGLVSVGDKVELLNGTTVIGSATLTAEDITAGFVNVTVDPALTTDGVFNITARVNDVFGITSGNSPALAYILDTVLAAPTIELDDTALNIGDDATLTITFAESVTGLEVSDFTVENGMLSNLVEMSGSDGKVYTATFTPNADVEDATNVITLAAGTVTDVAANTTLMASTTANYTIDTKAPVVTGPVDNDATSFKITSNEAGSVQLRANSMNVGSAVTLTANTAATVTVMAQDSVTSATAVVSDAAGNTTNGATLVVLGTAGNDGTINGTDADELIYGFDGNDKINGGNGNDTIYGGAGLLDELSGGEGDDVIIDTDSVRLVRGGEGNDRIDLTLTAQNPTGVASSFLQGNGGDDTITLTFNNVNPRTAALNFSTDSNTAGQNSDDKDSGGQRSGDTDGNDTLTIKGTVPGGGTAFQFNTNGGNDVVNTTLATFGTAPVFFLGEGNDTFTGGASAEKVFAWTGSDTVNTGAGNDLLNGGDGVDFLTPGMDSDVVESTAAITANADIIYGFVSGTDDFDYNGFSGASLVGPVDAVSATTFTEMLKVENTNVEVFIRTATSLGDNANASNALNSLAAATSEADVLSRYEAFETALLSNTGALKASNAAFNNALATVVGQGESLLLVLTNGSHSVALRYNNIDGNATTAAKVVTAAELELVGVFNGTAQLAAADFI